MAVFESLLHLKSQCQHLRRQHLMIKSLERTFIRASQLPLVGRRYYCEEDPPPSKRTLDTRRRTLLTKFLGKRVYAEKMKHYPTVNSRPSQDLLDAIKVLEEEGIQNMEIYSNLQVLELQATEIKRRFRSLKELGFAADIPEIIKYDFLLSETTQTLHRYGVLARTENPFENIAKRLECSPQLQDEISTACMNPDQLPLKKLRETIIKCIADHYLRFSSDDLTALFRILRSCSVSDIHRTIKIYTEELNIPVTFIQNHLLLLRKCPEELAKVIKIAEEYKLDLKFIMSKTVGILSKPAADIALMCRTLFDYGVTSAQIMRCPRIFRYSLKYTVNSLAAVSQWQEFPLLKMEDKFLRVLLNFKRADVHVRYLRNAGFERGNVGILTSRDSHFKQRLYRGDNIKSCKELVQYISNVLNVPCSDVFAGLHNHPLFVKTSVSNAKSVLTYLLTSGFTQRQILNGIALVVHPKGKVEKEWTVLPELEMIQPFADWVDSDYILHLLLYVIEKGESISCKPEVEMLELTKSLDSICTKEN